MSFKEKCVQLLQNSTVDAIPLVPELIEINSKSTLQQAFQTLLNNNILSAPVYLEEEGEYTGFLDLRDLISFVVFVYDNANLENDIQLAHIVSNGKNLIKSPTAGGVTVSYLSRRNKFTPVHGDDSLLRVAEILASGTHRVPVMGPNGRVISIISQSNINSV
eukprot:TRINITY_DN1300_c0_g1_i2.p1 TRINITY_DN1300_c0_g1~~TRINITY_DN1300_c0_g1_i2.p1  ORF type:complete len:162 (-),score=30.58 TRINITY_DN1300_c0_g1_i2:526-1011(-)